MWQYLKLHEAHVRRMLDRDLERERLVDLRRFHRRQIALMQHERLVHLLVTLFCALFLLLAMGFAAVTASLPAGAMALLLLVLVSAYIVHYFRLENGIQRWYHLDNRIGKKLGKGEGACYQEGKIAPWVDS